MRSFLIAVLLLAAGSLFCQNKPNFADSCYVIQKMDTAWKTTCVQTMPEFPGGQDSLYKFLAKKTNYPKIAKENNVQGKVFVAFVINKLGDIRDIEIYNSRFSAIDSKGKPLEGSAHIEYKKGIVEIEEEALRVVKSMPLWTPGKQDGKAVSVKYILPFSFKLR